MATLKELEKQRIEKIKSLDSTQIKNYADVLIIDLCKLHDFDNVTDPDETLNEIADLYCKLEEIKELTGDRFNNINNYININLNANLSIAETVVIEKYIVKDMELKNLLLSLHLKTISSAFADFKFYSAILDDLLSDFKELSDIAPEFVDKKKSKYIDFLEAALFSLKDEIETESAILSNAFHSDVTIKKDIHEIKNTIKNYAESDNESDKLFVEFGLIDVLADLIKAYERHAEIKDSYMLYKQNIDDLFE